MVGTVTTLHADRGINAEALLRAVFISAWLQNPQKHVAAPTLNPTGEATVAEVVRDELCGEGGDALFDEMLRIIKDASCGTPVTARSSALMAQIATRYSRFHAPDVILASREGVL